METSQTVERAFRVLACFSETEHELTAAEIARRVGLTRTIVMRLLGTLVSAGYLERSERDARYRVGLGAFEIGSLYVKSNPLFGVISETLARLVDETGFTAYFGVMDGGEAVIVSHHEGSRPVRVTWTAGDRLPIATTAVGKAVLVHLSAAELDRVLGKGKIAGRTERSIATRQELDEDLAEAKRKGWVMTRGESVVGISAIGAGVVGPEGRPIGGISLSFLDLPEDKHDIERIGALVREAAARISERAVTYALYGHRLMTAGAETRRPARMT